MQGSFFCMYIPVACYLGFLDFLVIVGGFDGSGISDHPFSCNDRICGKGE